MVHSIHGCSSVSSGHPETSEPLRTVSLHAPSLTSASLRMVLSYKLTHICSYMQALISEFLTWVMPCSPCIELLVYFYPSTNCHWHVCPHAPLHGCFTVLNSNLTLFPHVVLAFTPSLFKESNHQYHFLSFHSPSWHCLTQIVVLWALTFTVKELWIKLQHETYIYGNIAKTVGEV